MSPPQKTDRTETLSTPLFHKSRKSSRRLWQRSHNNIFFEKKKKNTWVQSSNVWVQERACSTSTYTYTSDHVVEWNDHVIMWSYDHSCDHVVEWSYDRTIRWWNDDRMIMWSYDHSYDHVVECLACSEPSPPSSSSSLPSSGSRQHSTDGSLYFTHPKAPYCIVINITFVKYSSAVIVITILLSLSTAVQSLWSPHHSLSLSTAVQSLWSPHHSLSLRTVQSLWSYIYICVAKLLLWKIES